MDYKILNRRHLKLIAAITMLIDHLSSMLYSHIFIEPKIYFFLRSIGRIAFPLYVYMFIEGIEKTKNKKKHLLMLLILSLISEPFFDKALNNSWIYWGHQNVIFIFLISACFIYLSEFLSKSIPKYSNLLAFIFMFPACYISQKFNIDYGYLGIVAIFVMYFLRNRKLLEKLSILITFYFEANMLYFVYISILILLLYCEKEPKYPKIEKKSYQYFYPIHLAVLSFVQYVFLR